MRVLGSIAISLAIVGLACGGTDGDDLGEGAPPGTDARADTAAATDAPAAGDAPDGAGDAVDVREVEPDADPLDAAEGPDASAVEDGDAALGDAETGDDAAPIVAPESVSASSRFPLGVAAGDVTSERAIVWTRYDGAAPLELVVWQVEGSAYVAEVAAIPVTPADGGFVHVDVPGLVAGKRHRYAFFELGAGRARVARSGIGRFRAALAPGQSEKLLFGATSCTNNSRALSTLERAGARDDLDAFFLLGDTTYNDGSLALAEFRAKWAQNLSTPGYRALRASTSILATWDDHEIDNDWKTDSIDPNKRAAGTRAFFEDLPIRRSTVDPNRIWRSVRWGDVAEIFVLDGRGERRPSTRTTAAAEYVSPAQLAWLKDGLAKSTAAFKLILNSVPITAWPGLFDVAIADRWEGYAAQRAEILRFVDDQKLRGVLWIAGDFHLATMGRVSPSGPGSTQIEVLVGPGANSANPLTTILSGSQFDWKSGTSNYATFGLDPVARSIEVTFFDGEGKVLQRRTYTP
jgi:alkaline phosphatase D